MIDEAYRAGPWPGLTPRGAAVLLGCALLLAAGQLVLGSPRQPMPDVPMLAVLSLVPLALATRVVNAPGAASAVCGAYLLPRSLVSLVDPSIEPPPLLLIPALAFDVYAWLRATDLSSVLSVWPRRARVLRRRTRRPRRVGVVRAASAGTIFGVVLALVEPPLAVLLGADASLWSGPDVWLATAVSAASCGMIGLSARGTGS